MINNANNNAIYRTNTHYAKQFCIPLYLSGLFLFSYITIKITNTHFLTTLISYFIDIFIFYLWHVQAHHDYWFIPFNKICHHYHEIHHKQFFPPSDFYGEKKQNEWITKNHNFLYLIYQSLPLHELNFIESLKNEGFAIILGLIILLIKMFIIKLSYLTILMTLIQTFTINFFGNYLHLSYHIKNHWLSKYEWYKDLRYLHYLHHCGDTKHNYLIMFFGFDIIFKSYKKKITVHAID
jgi:hypothetical protein